MTEQTFIVYKGLEVIKTGLTLDELISFKQKYAVCNYTYKPTPQPKEKVAKEPIEDFKSRLSLSQINDLELGLREIKYSSKEGSEGWYLRKTEKEKDEEIRVHIKTPKEYILEYLNSNGNYIWRTLEHNFNFSEDEFINVLKSLK